MLHPLIIASGILLNPLSPHIQEALSRVRGVSSFYSHQASAIDAVLNNKHVIVSTSTASGKSIVYQVGIFNRPWPTCLLLEQVPVLAFLERDPASTAIFIYPTKAGTPCLATPLLTLAAGSCTGSEGRADGAVDLDPSVRND